MQKVQFFLWIVLIIVFVTSCDWKLPENNEGLVQKDTTLTVQDSLPAKIDSKLIDSTTLVNSPIVDNAQNKDTAILIPSKAVDIKSVHPNDVMNFAETLLGTPYVWGSTDPKVGFDCSGFITYVFNHFGIQVPRSSIDFTNIGKDIPVGQAKRGDIILFTGTNPAERHVGHMGLVVSNTDTLRFIHSTSGKAMSVAISLLSKYYQSRFVKTLRIFPQND
jgi:cell wall-associated NlpC family hydrolase